MRCVSVVSKRDTRRQNLLCAPLRPKPILPKYNHFQFCIGVRFKASIQRYKCCWFTRPLLCPWCANSKRKNRLKRYSKSTQLYTRGVGNGKWREIESLDN
jgi:hypothetical protein